MGGRTKDDLMVSFVPALLETKGWTLNEFTGRCLLGGLSADTARRLAKGDTTFNSETLGRVARVFGLDSIAKVVDLRK